MRYSLTFGGERLWSYWCHLVYVWRCFPQCEQEWCASWRLGTINGIRQQPQITPIKHRSKHVSQAAFPGWCLTLVASTWWQWGHCITAGASLRCVTKTGTGCGWVTTGSVCLLLTDVCAPICVVGCIMTPVFREGNDPTVGTCGGVRTGKGSGWAVTASP